MKLKRFKKKCAFSFGFLDKRMLILLGLFLFSDFYTYGQGERMIGEANYQSPFIVMIYESTSSKGIENKVKDYVKNENGVFLLIDGSEISSSEIKNRLNNLLNSALPVDKTRIYLIVVGDVEFFDEQSKLTHDIFASRYYLKTADESVNVGSFLVSSFEDANMPQIVDELSEQYLWQFELDKIKKEHFLEYHKSRKFYGFGLSLANTVPLIFGSVGNLPAIYSSYRLSGFRRINKKWKVEANVLFSFNLPKPQEELRDQVTSQLSTSMLNSDDEVSFDLNTEIKGNLGFSLGVSARRLFRNNKKLMPYVGAGISYNNYTIMYAEIDTTMTLEGNSIISGGLKDSFDFNRDENSDMENGQFSYVGVDLTGGFEYKIGSKFIADVSLGYNFALDTFNPAKSSMNNIFFNIGVSYRIFGRKQKFFEYIRLK